MPSFEREILINEAIDLFDRGELSKAEQNLRAVLRDDPKRTEARYYLALVLLQSGRSEEALGELDRAAETAPELSKPSLERGLALLGAGRAEQAIENLQKVVEASPDNGLARLMLGAALFRADKLDRAERQLRRARQLDPDLGGYVDVYLGLIAAREGRGGEARKLLVRSATLAPTSELGQRAFTLVEQLEGLERKKPKPWYIELRLGLNFDSNVILQGQNTDLPRRIGRKADFRTGTNFDLHYRLVDRDRFSVTLGGSTFHSWHADISDFNLQVYAGNAQADFLIGQSTRLALRYDYEYSLLGNDPLLSLNQITPQITHAWTDWTSTTGFYQYGHGNFLTPVSDRRFDLDFDRQSVGVIQSFQTRVADRPVLFNLGYRFDNESTAGDDFDRIAHSLSAGVSASLPWEFIFEFSSEWRWERYKQANTVDFLRDRRGDRIQTYVFALTRPLNRNVSVRGEIDLIFDDSNVITRAFEAPFSYDRAIYGVSLICKF